MFATLVLSACGGGGNAESTPPTAVVTTVQAAGTVVDDQGFPLAGATVKVLSASTAAGTTQTIQTDANGQFALTLDVATPAVLRVDKAGYTAGFQAAPAAADNAQVAPRMVLLPVASTQSFDPTQAAVLRVPGSAARVELAAGSLVRADGQAPSGSATVALTPIDPSADIARMPGLLVDATSGEPIESLGALTVNFSDATGAALNLGSGKAATIRIPATAAAGANGSLPASFPLYHLNESSGRWTREGTATLKTDAATGAPYYEGVVSHFSTWNADQVWSRSFIDLTTTTTGTRCTLTALSQVWAFGVDYNGRSATNGETLPVRARSQVRLQLLDSRGLVLDTLTLSSGAAGGTERLPRCLVAPASVRVTGRVVLGSGSLANYRVQISGERASTVTVPVQTDGSYAVDVPQGAGLLRARLVAALDYGTPDTTVTTQVATAATTFPDLVVNDSRFTLQGCVQGWAEYRRNAVLVSVFRGSERLGPPQMLQNSSPNFQFSNLPLNSTLSLRLTPADPTLAEARTELVVGATAPALSSCLSLPLAPSVAIQASSNGLTVNYAAQLSGGEASPAITGHAWTFGDGGTGSGSTVSHTYTTAGTYTVTLTVTDALGQMATASLSQTVSAQVSTLPPARSIAGGDGHACANTLSGGLKCWGFNSTGQLGNASNTNSSTAVDVFGLETGIVSVATAAYSTCALNQAGAVHCWGLNGSGQVGDGSNVNRSTPVAVSGLGSGVVAISAGWEHMCALTSAGAVKCWGAGSNGQLGQGSIANSRTPVDVVGLSSGVLAISTGAYHSCALTSAGAVRCWGGNFSGQLGNGTTTNSTAPVAVQGLEAGVVALDAFGEHSCAITSARGLVCWGLGLSGQLGQGSNTSSSVPVAVSGLGSGVAAVNAGSYHTCALTQAGAVLCWGFNSNGQLGNGSTTRSNVPVAVTGLGSGAVAIGAGSNFSCALTPSGAQCWGFNNAGRLGDGSTTDRSTPVTVVNFQAVEPK
ncbi:PKD domain-containing protein [Roseateles sp. LKC17W]|uniref:PKD domain-containing protein n=1 Tax=Pelomonas margarita TaxID=3299031 RepID=A0ABW7FCG7_9BURK